MYQNKLKIHNMSKIKSYKNNKYICRLDLVLIKAKIDYSLLRILPDNTAIKYVHIQLIQL